VVRSPISRLSASPSRSAISSTVVAASFFYGYLRLASGSVWPASIAHATHNTISGMITGFTVTSAPLLVNGYLLGEFGILITAAAAIVAALVSRLVSHDSEGHESGTHAAPVSDRASRAPTAPQADPH
jgi:hypothetical protein